MDGRIVDSDAERIGLRIALYISLAIAALLYFMSDKNQTDPVRRDAAQAIAYVAGTVALAGLAASVRH